MDTLTHTLVGSAISDGWFRRRLGPVATPFALVMSALPDIDILTYFIAPEYAWMHHRGYTHSFLPMLVASPVFGYAGYRIAKKNGSWFLWSLLAVLCLFSHTIIDLVTSWGTMPLLPFSSARISWDVAPILDVFVFSVAGASFVANRILRWERVDTFLNPLKYPIVHRHPRRQRAADRVGMIAAILVVLYLLIGWQQNRQTVRIAREELARGGVEAVEVRALPIMFTYIAWDIAARDANGTVYNAVYSSYAPRSMRFTAFPTLPRDEIAGELATPEGCLFAWYSQNMFVADREWLDSGSRVSLRDRRFFGLVNPAESRFVMEFDKDPSGTVTDIRSVQGGPENIDLREELRRLWGLMWDGRDAGPDENVKEE